MESKQALGHRYIISAKAPHFWAWKCERCSSTQHTEVRVRPHPSNLVLVKSGLVGKMEHLSCEEYVLWQVMR